MYKEGSVSWACQQTPCLEATEQLCKGSRKTTALKCSPCYNSSTCSTPIHYFGGLDCETQQHAHKHGGTAQDQGWSEPRLHRALTQFIAWTSSHIRSHTRCIHTQLCPPYTPSLTGPSCLLVRSFTAISDFFLHQCAFLSFCRT